MNCPPLHRLHHLRLPAPQGVELRDIARVASKTPCLPFTTERLSTFAR